MLSKDRICIGVGDLAGAKELVHTLPYFAERGVTCDVWIDEKGLPAQQFLNAAAVTSHTWTPGSSLGSDVLWLLGWSTKATRLQNAVLDLLAGQTVLYRDSPLNASRSIGPEGQPLSRRLLVTDSASAGLTHEFYADLPITVVGKPTFGDGVLQQRIEDARARRSVIRKTLGVSEEDMLVVAWFGGESQIRTTAQLEWFRGIAQKGVRTFFLPRFHPSQSALAYTHVLDTLLPVTTLIPLAAMSVEELVVAANINCVDIGGTAGLVASIANAPLLVMMGPNDDVYAQYRGQHVLVSQTEPGVYNVHDLQTGLCGIDRPERRVGAGLGRLAFCRELCVPGASWKIARAVIAELEEMTA